MFSLISRIIFWFSFPFSFVFIFYFIYQKDFFLAITFLLGLIALFIVFLIQRSLVIQKHYNVSFKDSLIGIVGLIYILSCLGTLSFWSWNLNIWFQYDVLMHFVEPVFFVILAAMIFEILYLKKNKNIPNNFQSTIAAGILISFLVLVWEWYEWQGDLWWGTYMFYDLLQGEVLDFATDITADFYGIFLGSALVFAKWEKWNKKWLKSINNF